MQNLVMRKGVCVGYIFGLLARYRAVKHECDFESFLVDSKLLCSSSSESQLGQSSMNLSLSLEDWAADDDDGDGGCGGDGMAAAEVQQQQQGDEGDKRKRAQSMARAVAEEEEEEELEHVEEEEEEEDDEEGKGGRGRAAGGKPSAEAWDTKKRSRAASEPALSNPEGATSSEASEAEADGSDIHAATRRLRRKAARPAATGLYGKPSNGGAASEEGPAVAKASLQASTSRMHDEDCATGVPLTGGDSVSSRRRRRAVSTRTGLAASQPVTAAGASSLQHGDEIEEFEEDDDVGPDTQAC